MKTITNSYFHCRWADTQTSESTDGKVRHFRHPFLQACGMFLGEMSCMIAFYILKCYRDKKRQRELVRKYNNNYRITTKFLSMYMVDR